MSDRYEYRLITHAIYIDDTPDTLAEQMTEAGSDGWRFVGSYPLKEGVAVIMERPADDAGHPPDH